MYTIKNKYSLQFTVLENSKQSVSGYKNQVYAEIFKYTFQKSSLRRNLLKYTFQKSSLRKNVLKYAFQKPVDIISTHYNYLL